MTGTRKLIFNLAKSYRKGNTVPTHSIRDKDDNLLIEPQEISQRWTEYFEDLLNFPGQDEAEREYNLENGRENEVEDIGENEWVITEVEVRAAVEKMKNGKASGEDDISIEIIKKMGNTGLKWMLEVINLAWRNKQVPDDWAKAVICPIHKKGDKTDCGNSITHR